MEIRFTLGIRSREKRLEPDLAGGPLLFCGRPLRGIERHRGRAWTRATRSVLSAVGSGVRWEQEVALITGKTEVRVNDRIRAPMVRVIGPDGSQLGVMAISEALRQARELEQDLVEVAPQARPPVCRIMDFGKYKYESAKREQKARKKQHQTIVKEVKLRPKIEEHDFQFKMKHARTFLLERDKVKITVMFRGRELSHPELGYELMEEVVRTLDDVANVEQRPTQDGRSLVMMLSPKPSAKKEVKPSVPEESPLREKEA